MLTIGAWVVGTIVLLVLLGWLMLSYLGKCKHDWEVVTKTTGESVIEHMNRVGKTGSMRYTDMRELTGRPFILVLKCRKCGKLNKTKGMI